MRARGHAEIEAGHVDRLPVGQAPILAHLEVLGRLHRELADPHLEAALRLAQVGLRRRTGDQRQDETERHDAPHWWAASGMEDGTSSSASERGPWVAPAG